MKPQEEVKANGHGLRMGEKAILGSEKSNFSGKKVVSSSEGARTLNDQVLHSPSFFNTHKLSGSRTKIWCVIAIVTAYLIVAVTGGDDRMTLMLWGPLIIIGVIVGGVVGVIGLYLALAGIGLLIDLLRILLKWGIVALLIYCAFLVVKQIITSGIL